MHQYAFTTSAQLKGDESTTRLKILVLQQFILMWSAVILVLNFWVHYDLMYKKVYGVNKTISINRETSCVIVIVNTTARIFTIACYDTFESFKLTLKK